MRWALVVGAFLAACSSETPEYGGFANGSAILRVGIMQGVDNTLYRSNGRSPRDTPVIARRDGLLRFFVNTTDGWEPRDLTGVLRLRDGEGELVEELTSTEYISGRSSTSDLGSTINFRLTGDQIKQNTEFSFELRETDPSRGGGSREQNSFDSELQAGGLDPAPTDTLNLVIVPIRYQADGSSRVPDITPGHIREIEEAMYALYPTNEVVVRVEEPADWFDEVAPNGAGWGNLLGAVSQRAAQSDEAPNTYYYGMFDPTTSIQAYCRRGCILGLATLATIPEDFPRAAIGLGFRGPAVETLVHEVGHSHGLPHAPCGQVATFDRDYPYEDGEIGVWGYNLVRDQLREPSRHDMMGYCDPIWISDYNFGIIHDRILELRDVQRSQPYEVSRLFIDEAGKATSVGTVRVRRPSVSAEMVSVDLYADGELVRTVEGAFEPFDHIGGGAVVLDEVLADGLTARVRR